MATRLILQNLTNSRLSIDLKFGERRQLRLLLLPLAREDITGRATLPELETNTVLTGLRDSGKVSLLTERTSAEAQTIGGKRFLLSKMLGTGPVTGGGTTATVGFQLVDESGEDVRQALLVEMAVFDDDGMTIPAVNATLDTAIAGEILAGAGGPALKVRTDALGQFRCTLTDLADETVYVACSSTFGGPVLDSQDADAVTFSA